MTDLQKIVLWFGVCLILGIYAKLSGIVPVKIGQNPGAVLGTQNTTSNYGSFAPLNSNR